MSAKAKGDPRVGRALRVLRKRADLTQAQVAEAAEMGDDRISRYETASNDISMTALLPLLRACRATLWDLAALLQPHEAPERGFAPNGSYPPMGDLSSDIRERETDPAELASSAWARAIAREFRHALEGLPEEIGSQVAEAVGRRLDQRREW